MGKKMGKKRGKKRMVRKAKAYISDDGVYLGAFDDKDKVPSGAIEAPTAPTDARQRYINGAWTGAKVPPDELKDEITRQRIIRASGTNETTITSHGINKVAKFAVIDETLTKVANCLEHLRSLTELSLPETTSTIQDDEGEVFDGVIYANIQAIYYELYRTKTQLFSLEKTYRDQVDSGDITTLEDVRSLDWVFISR